MESSAKTQHTTLSTLREAAPHCVGACLVFCMGGAWGYLRPQSIVPQLESLRGFAESLEGYPAIALAGVLFLKNSMAAVFALLFGPLFGLFPVYSALVNGAVAGAVVNAEPAAAWLVIPHGIFELPAMFIAWGLGMWTGSALLSKEAVMGVGGRFRAVWPVFLKVVLPLLFIAAIIEASLIHFSLRG